MSSLPSFLQSEQVLALLIAVLIFVTTLFLAVKRWINFSMTFLLLLFSLATGLLINHQSTFHAYLNPPSRSLTPSMLGEDSQDAFQKQVLQAIENLKLEINTEKENLQRVMHQIQEIFDSMDAQKQKIQNFIDEKHKQFQKDSPPTSTSSSSEEPVDEKNLESEVHARSL